MTARDEDDRLWKAAVKAFRGKAMVDIQLEAGVSASVARRLREGATTPNYLHSLTRIMLKKWQGEQIPSQPTVPTPDVVAAVSQRPDMRELPTFVTEAERRGFLKKVLFDAERAIQEARAALDAPLSESDAAALFADGLDVASPTHHQAGAKRPPARKRT